MGRLKAQQARLRLVGSAQPAAQQAGSVLGLAGSSWAMTLLGPRWAGGLLLLRLLLHAGCFCPLSFTLTGQAQASVSAGFGVVGLDLVRQEGVRVCVPECGCVAPEGCSGKGLKGLAATRTRRRGHVAGLTRTARPWRRHGEAGRGRAWCGLEETRRGGDTAWPRGAGVHACARVLASQGRGVAVPCAGHRHPGPAARCGGGEATAVAGETAARRALARKDGTAARGEWEVLRPGYAGFVGNAGSKGKGGKETAATVPTGGAEGESARCGRETVPWRGEAGPCSAGLLV
jgi:hypothetical protein